MKKIIILTFIFYTIFITSCKQENVNTKDNHKHISTEHTHEHSSNEHDEKDQHSHKSHAQDSEKQDHEHNENCDHSHDHDTDEHDHSKTPHNENLKTKIIRPELFTKTLNTTGTIKVSPTSEYIINAKTSGVIKFQNNNLVIGSDVKNGSNLFTISGEEMANNNINVQFVNAKNNYRQSKENFLRAKSLITENIISQKEFLARKSKFESDSTSYYILKKNFSFKALQINSPTNGKLFQLYVQNGEYVNAGQQLAIISKNCQNYIEVDLPKKYFTKIQNINSGKFQMEYDNKIYSFDHNSKISTGDRIKHGDPFIPISFSLEHNHDLIAGSFAEVWLNIEESKNSIVVPKSAIIEQQGLYFVFVKHAKDDYEKTLVTLDAINADKVKIDSGIDFGMEVVIDGVIELKLANSGSAATDSHYGHNH